MNYPQVAIGIIAGLASYEFFAATVGKSVQVPNVVVWGGAGMVGYFLYDHSFGVGMVIGGFGAALLSVYQTRTTSDSNAEANLISTGNALANLSMTS